MVAVFTHRVVETDAGVPIGRICYVHRRNAEGKWVYQGSYFERILAVPVERVGDCRNYGINSFYLNQREWAERSAVL